MPELPEVQTIVDDLNKKIIKRRITGVWFDTPKIIKKPKPQDLRLEIKDLRIVAVQRRGKNILIYLQRAKSKEQGDFLLLIHQKMTGHLLYGKWKIYEVYEAKPRNFKAVSLIKGSLQEKVNNYIHLVFYLDNGWQLALSDLRKFAKVLFGLKEEIENLPDLTKLGPEPIESLNVSKYKSINFSKFKILISREKRKIKQVLMDQEVIAGIGNIYSDEILWTAKVYPFKPADKLTNSEINKIYSAMKQILKKAIKLRGTSISDFRDTSGKAGGYAEIRKVYQREDEKCPRCGELIKRVKLGGRSAHFCPICQKI